MMQAREHTTNPTHTAAIIAFTKRGANVSEHIAHALEAATDTDGATWTATRAIGFGPNKVSLAAWTADAWTHADALVFVGATGIAVRAIAPHVSNKLADPAVVVVNEGATWAIPLLSGHVGGANRLARTIAQAVGAEAVVTTATDGRGLWAVDEWAAQRGMTIANPARIKAVSGMLLAGSKISVRSDVPIEGDAPTGVHRATKGTSQVVVTPFATESASGASFEPLRLIPRCIAVGVGCHRNISVEAVEHAVDSALARAGIDPAAIARVCSIDLKRDEAGLIAFCDKRNLPFITYPAAVLERVEGSISPSSFVKSITGVDNVCERAALAEGGTLLARKHAEEGVTTAIALLPCTYTWKDER